MAGDREVASALNNIARQMHARNNIERDKVTAMQEIAKRLPMIETPAERPAADTVQEVVHSPVDEPAENGEPPLADDEVEGMSDDD